MFNEFDGIVDEFPESSTISSNSSNFHRSSSWWLVKSMKSMDMFSIRWNRWSISTNFVGHELIRWTDIELHVFESSTSMTPSSMSSIFIGSCISMKSMNEFIEIRWQNSSTVRRHRNSSTDFVDVVHCCPSISSNFVDVVHACPSISSKFDEHFQSSTIFVGGGVSI